MGPRKTRTHCLASTSLWTWFPAHLGFPLWTYAAGTGKCLSALKPDQRRLSALGGDCGNFESSVLACVTLPATFERLIEKVLADIPRQECLVYLDDILVHGSSFEAALTSLRLALQRIAAGLKLHPDKCCFMRRELEFLGHKIGGEGNQQAGRSWCRL